MMGQIEWEELAKKYAYETITCPGSPIDIDSVLEAWGNDKRHPDAIVWEPFEYFEPGELLDQFENLECSFLRFAREILGK